MSKGKNCGRTPEKKVDSGFSSVVLVYKEMQCKVMKTSIYFVSE